MRILTNEDIRTAAEKLARQLKKTIRHIYGVPRGGVPAAMALANCLTGSDIILVDRPEDCDMIVDDIVATGSTRVRFSKYKKEFVALFSKAPFLPCLYGTALNAEEYVVFPWEGTAEYSAEDIPQRLLEFIGEDPKRGGLKETPRRFLKAWQEWTSGYGKQPGDVFKTFEDGAEHYDEFVIVKGIPLYSHCEHHLAPFFGHVSIGYIPDKCIVGLSKFSRLVNVFARRLQVQERLTTQIAEAIQTHLSPKAVGVVMECRHMCMESRGICIPGSVTTTSAMLGLLRDEPETRAEFLNLIRR